MIAFIILHYKNLKDTKDCISSIKKNAKDSKIIVVSNSQDEENLKKIEKQVDLVIRNKENLGFAKANNIACQKAIDMYHPDFLCVINNDILITQKDFSKKIELIYQKDPFDCLGPKINTEGGDSVNPFPVYKTEQEVKKAIQNAKMWNFIYKSSLLRTLYGIYKKYKKPHSPLQNGKVRQKDVALHGCALIFSKKYYEKYKTVFEPGTFLYHEEEFLFLRQKKDNLLFIYDPLIEVFHKEGSSLNYNYQSEVAKMIFRNKERIKSLELLLEKMKGK